MVAWGIACLASPPVWRLGASQALVLSAVPMATPLPPSGPPLHPRTRVGSELEETRVLGGSTAVDRACKGYEEASCSASDAGAVREVPLSLGNRNCCHGRSCIR